MATQLNDRAFTPIDHTGEQGPHSSGHRACLMGQHSEAARAGVLAAEWLEIENTRPRVLYAVEQDAERLARRHRSLATQDRHLRVRGEPMWSERAPPRRTQDSGAAPIVHSPDPCFTCR